MSEDFVKRWSRRKQEAKSAEIKSADVVAEPAPPLPAAGAQGTAVTTSPQAGQEGEIDLSKLPPIDSITAATDITAFLRENIPAELSRAALRRAWAADPAIRDFVGLAENAWDFTDPNAMPGFGALQGTPEQIGAMVERVLGGIKETAEKLVSDLPEKEQAPQKSAEHPDVSVSAEPLRAAIGAPLPHDADAEPVVAAQPEASEQDDDNMPIRRRSHGGALPS